MASAILDKANSGHYIENLAPLQTLNSHLSSYKPTK